MRKPIPLPGFAAILAGIFLTFTAAAQTTDTLKPGTETQAGTGMPAIFSGSNADSAVLAWPGAEIIVIDVDGASLQARHNDTTRIFAVIAPELKKVVASLQAGDRADFTYSRTGNRQSLLTIEIAKEKTGKALRMWMLAGVTAGVLILFRLLLRRKLRTLIIGTDNRYSNSQFQIVVWFSMLIITYVTVNIMRGMVSTDFVGGVNIPSNLLLLSGFSALTFATAKGITESKNQQAAQQNRPVKQPAASPSFPTDLFRNDADTIDMADFQMVTITLLAVIVYLFQVFDFLGTIELIKVVTLPDIDSTILATFGLGHGAYLAKKYVGGIDS